jgi:hypothetical protein
MQRTRQAVRVSKPSWWKTACAVCALCATATGATASGPTSGDKARTSTTALSSLPAEARPGILAALSRDLRISQLAELTASDGSTGDDLAWSVSVNGNTIAVGTPNASIGSNSAQGAVYVFVKPAGGWTNMTQTAKLTASDGAAGDQLGWSVSISGNTIVAGAPNATVGGNQHQGAAYVFVEPSGGWVDMTQTAKLTASDGASQDSLGFSVSISNITVLAGAPGADSLLGAAYVFVKPLGGWANISQQAKLAASDSKSGGKLGWSVSVSGVTAVAGAILDGPGQAGAIYVFVKPSNGWHSTTQTAQLDASDGMPDEQLGYSVAINGGTVVAGAPYDTTSGPPGSEQGAAYVFVEPSQGWTAGNQTAKLTAADGQVGDQLGRSVSLSGTVLSAGAWRANNLEGKAYLYLKPPGGWQNTSVFNTELSASDGSSGDVFAASMGAGNDVSVAGAPGHLGVGAAYVFGP